VVFVKVEWKCFSWYLDKLRSLSVCDR
jgi:hypothetical protein